MAKKPSKKDAAILELADKLVQVLQAQRGLGPEAYPLPVKRLVELTDPSVPPATIKKALNKKSFLQRAISAHGKSPEAPIALAEDLDRLAASPLLLEFVLRQARTGGTQAFTVSKLKAKTAGKVQKPFQEAINRQIADGTLPSTVGWISISGRKQLFLLADLHTGKPAEARVPVQPAPAMPAPAAPIDFRKRFDEAFSQLDREGGGHNFVSLIALRRALPLPRADFDRELRELRRSGGYALSAAEGRDGISAEEREAGITEEGSLLLFVSRNLP